MIQDPPMVLIGFVRGILRLERSKETGGAEELSYPFLNNWGMVLERPKDGWGVTHLQKQSKFGFLLQRGPTWWMFCLNIWWTFKYQEWKEGGWVPGSEKVWYFRAGTARWDAGQGTYEIPTWYGPFNLHWD